MHSVSKRRAWAPSGLVLAVGLFAAESAHAQYYADPPGGGGGSWYDDFELSAFADAYLATNFNFPKPQANANGLRAYDANEGFAISWVGIDVGYDPDPVGGKLSLRMGPTANIIASCSSADRSANPCDSDLGLQYVKQAYASWMPGGADGSVTLDIGKFDTIYGAEVAESQGNFNYTRGLLYWLAQPLFHTGLRVRADFTPQFSGTAMVVNGWNNSVDNNAGKTFGLQLGYSPNENIGLMLGWLGGPEQEDRGFVACGQGESLPPGASQCVATPGVAPADYAIDRGGANSPSAWRHLIDFVATVDATEQLSFVFNFDYGAEGVRIDPQTDETRSEKWYGAMLGARYALSDVWAVAGRGEYYGDPDGRAVSGTDVALASPVRLTDVALLSGTLTLEAAPTENLIFRLDARDDMAIDSSGSKAFFDKKVRDHRTDQITATLGVVVTTN
jgi:hypothetical protein